MATLSDYKGLDVVEGATGAGGQALTNNFKELADRAPFESTSNPTASSDSNQGFQKGSTWLNTTTQVLWICINDAPSAAVWKSVYKRTATALELIPEEAGDKVHVTGSLQVNGQATLPNGSLAEPSLAFATDTNTGVFRVAEGVVGISSNGVEQARFNNGYPNAPTTMIGPNVDLWQNGGWPGHNAHVASNNSSHCGYLLLWKAGGTISTPSSTPSGSNLGILGFRGCVGTEWAIHDQARVVAIATEEHSSTGRGTKLQFQTTVAGTATTKVSLELNGDLAALPGNLNVAGNTIRLQTARTPASSSATGNQGDMCWDSSYSYICVATNTWRRIPHDTW